MQSIPKIAFASEMVQLDHDLRDFRPWFAAIESVDCVFSISPEMSVFYF